MGPCDFESRTQCFRASQGALSKTCKQSVSDLHCWWGFLIGSTTFLHCVFFQGCWINYEFSNRFHENALTIEDLAEVFMSR